MKKTLFVLLAFSLICCKNKSTQDTSHGVNDTEADIDGLMATLYDLDSNQLEEKRINKLKALLKKAGVSEEKTQTLAKRIMDEIGILKWDTLEYDDSFFEEKTNAPFLIALYHGPIDGNGRGLTLMAITKSDEPHVYLSDGYWSREEIQFTNDLYENISKKYKITPETITIVVNDNFLILNQVSG